MTGSRAHPARIDVDLQRHAVPPLADLRARIRVMLAAEDPDCVEDVELLATELVSNAYDHGVQPLFARLWVPDQRKLVRMEVADADPSHLPVLGLSRFGANRGRGLVMVDQLAQRWGSAVRSWGKTIWAEVVCGHSAG
ncbi:ATP-binding protein [Umezawaea endophytica]|uniref:ATP-binding protein n=1 Tax=Umezawaea endophytica TaxID=1654476 RepID=A0A9X2VKQ8_9PSEU|nr:ATP-binding protein [Umezawaea endophytica]MCS7478443.1 ATP-binding protein [Umezawaea endophytica]